MTSDLERERAISPLVNKIRLGRPSDREPAQNEWPRRESTDLGSCLSLFPNQSDPFCLAELLARNEQVPVLLLQKVARPTEPIATSCVVISVGGKCLHGSPQNGVQGRDPGDLQRVEWRLTVKSAALLH